MKPRISPLWKAIAAGLVVVFVTVNCQFASSMLQSDQPAEVQATEPARESTASESIQATSEPETQAEPSESAAEPAPTGEDQSDADEPEEANLEFTVPEACFTEQCTVDGTFFLSRPIGPEGRQESDHSYRFGEYRQSTKDTHHGVKFLNSMGTPVLAAADGVVVVAGVDTETEYANTKGVYGNLVIIRHDLPDIGESIFTLYGQLSEVLVDVDDRVTAGQEIGRVGSSGRVTGSTLHFEVRTAKKAYDKARNPELWLIPLPDEEGQLTGAVAGRIVDSNGKFIPMSNIVIEQLGGPGEPAVDTLYLKTYGNRRLVGLEPWRENFAISDLQAGMYQISFWLNGMQQREIEIQPGKLTVVTFVLE